MTYYKVYQRQTVRGKDFSLVIILKLYFLHSKTLMIIWVLEKIFCLQSRSYFIYLAFSLLKLGKKETRYWMQFL